MIYLKVEGQYYKTNLRHVNDITIMAWEYITLLYDDKREKVFNKIINGPITTEQVKLELWTIDYEKLPYFNEEKFNNLKEHQETTGQIVRIQYTC